MTPRNIRFIDEMLLAHNATEAAINAGYSEKTAASIASELLQKPEIAKAICEKRANRAAVVGIDAAWVLKRLALLADFNIRDFIVIKGSVACYDFSEATRDDWYCISEYTIKAIRGTIIPVDEVKLKTFDKMQALKACGGHVNVQAFKEKLELTGKDGQPLIPQTIIILPAKNAED